MSVDYEKMGEAAATLSSDHAVFETLKHPVSIIGKDGLILYGNRAYHEFFTGGTGEIRLDWEHPFFPEYRKRIAQSYLAAQHGMEKRCFAMVNAPSGDHLPGRDIPFPDVHRRCGHLDPRPHDHRRRPPPLLRPVHPLDHIRGELPVRQPAFRVFADADRARQRRDADHTLQPFARGLHRLQRRRDTGREDRDLRHHLLSRIRQGQEGGDGPPFRRNARSAASARRRSPRATAKRK